MTKIEVKIWWKTTEYLTVEQSFLCQFGYGFWLILFGFPFSFPSEFLFPQKISFKYFHQIIPSNMPLHWCTAWHKSKKFSKYLSTSLSFRWKILQTISSRNMYHYKLINRLSMQFQYHKSGSLLRAVWLNSLIYLSYRCIQLHHKEINVHEIIYNT